MPSKAQDKLDKAIEAFQEENSPLTFDEKFAQLREALSWHAWERMSLVKKHGLKSKQTEEHAFIQEECMAQFKIMERMYNSQIKTNKMLGKSTDAIKTDFMTAIGQMKSSIGEIIAKIPINNAEHHLQN